MTYNKLFEQFYDRDEDQVRGLIAYGLYKVAKREWSKGYAAQKGRKPTEDEVIAYQETWTPSVVSGKQAEADQVLRSYADEIIKLERPRIIEDALRGSFWRTVWTNISPAPFIRSC